MKEESIWLKTDHQPNNNYFPQVLCFVDGEEEKLSSRALLSWGAGWQDSAEESKEKTPGEGNINIEEKIKCLSGESNKCNFNALHTNNTITDLLSDPSQDQDYQMTNQSHILYIPYETTPNQTSTQHLRTHNGSRPDKGNHTNSEVLDTLNESTRNLKHRFLNTQSQVDNNLKETRPEHGYNKRTEAMVSSPIMSACVGGQKTSVEGEVAGAAIWRRELGKSSLQAVLGCSSTQGALVSLPPPEFSLSDKWRVDGNASLRSYKKGELCAKLKTVLVRPAGTHTQHQRLCKSLGGSLPRSSVFSLPAILTSFQQGVVESCTGPGGLVTWVAGEAREGTRGSTDTECPGVGTDGPVWVSCEVQAACGVCQVGDGMVYNLYGHDGSLFDHTFYLSVDSNGEATFQGLANSVILRQNDGQWVLRSGLHQREWMVAGVSVPVGRLQWTVVGGETQTLLSLTICRTTQFACADGQCVPQTARCDDILHCHDHSDEHDCHVVERSKGYDATTVPPPRPGETIPILLPYHIDVYNVGDITTEVGEASMDVGITINWFDSRLKFLNLKPGIKNYFPCELVWTPRVRAVTGHGTGNVLHTNDYEKFCSVYANDEVEKRPLSDAFMGE